MTQRKYTESEYKVEELYPARVRWHAQSILDGQYGAVLKDLRSLPIHSINEIEVLKSTYHYLCQYYEAGSDDPDRQRILRETGRQIMKWVRRNSEVLEVGERPYHKRASIIRELRELFEGEMEGALVQQIDNLEASEPYSQEFFERLDLVFDLIWTTLELNKEEHDRILRYIDTVKDDLSARTLVAALFLGAMEFFDLEKLDILRECLAGEYSIGVRGNALASLLILSRRHQAELKALHPEFMEQMHTLLLREDINKELFSTLKIIFTSYKTTENHKVYQEKILPELTNLSDRLQQAMGNNLQERLNKLQEMDREKMEEVERLMMEKAGESFSMMRDTDQDVVYHMVTELKQFPFFIKVSHWFMPYDARYPGIDAENAEALSRLAPILFQGRQIISSDMYSYAFVNAWKSVEESILMQMEGMPVPEPAPKATEMSAVIEDFVFGIYRFYQLSDLSHGMVDPFVHQPYVLDGAFLQYQGLLSEESLHQLATLLVKYRQYEMAGWTYERMVNDYMTTSAEVWRGMAVANMMRGEDEKALKLLLQAVEIEGKTSITARKIAELMSKLGRKEEAVRWLEECENELDEDKGNLAYERAELLYDLGRCEEALQAAYKANFMSDGASEKIVVALSMILLKLNRADEALSIVDAGGEEEGERLLMKGVASMALGQKKEGIDILRDWYSRGSKGGELPERLALLESYGYEDWERALVLDVVLNQRDRDEE